MKKISLKKLNPFNFFSIVKERTLRFKKGSKKDYQNNILLMHWQKNSIQKNSMQKL